MKLERLLRKIFVPYILALFVSYLLSIIEFCNIDCLNFIQTQSSNDPLTAVIQIESLLFAAIITVLILRLNIIDAAIDKNLDRFNEILIKYGYYGYTLFGSQFEKNYHKLICEINSSDNMSLKNDFEKDKKNAKFCFETAHKKLKKYRLKHFEAVKYVLINFILIIFFALAAIHIDFDNFSLIFKKTFNTTIVIMTIYSLYESYGAIKALFNHPFDEL